MASAESTVRAYFEALNSSDVDAVTALFADDGSLLADEVPAATDLAGARRIHARRARLRASSDR
jgi:ketosteroid isomerase-like protein